MAVYRFGHGSTISQGATVRWAWNFGGKAVVPFAVQALPADMDIDGEGRLTVTHTGVEVGETASGDPEFYTHYADVTCESGFQVQYTLVVGTIA